MSQLLSPSRRTLGDTAVPRPSPHSPVPVYSDRLADQQQQQRNSTASESRSWEGVNARRVNFEGRGFVAPKSATRQLGAQTSSTVIDDSEDESDDDMDFLSPKNKSRAEPVKSDPISDAPFRSKISSNTSRSKSRSATAADLTRQASENRQLPNNNNQNTGAKLNLINVRTVFPTAAGQSSGRGANKSTSQQSRSTKSSQVSDRSQPSMPALPSQSRSQPSQQNTSQSTDNSVELLLPRQPQDFSIQASVQPSRPISSAKPVKSRLVPPHPFPPPSTHTQPRVVRSPSPSSAATRSAVPSTSQSTLESTVSDRAPDSAPSKRKKAPAQEQPQRVFKKRTSSSPPAQPEKTTRLSPELLDDDRDQDEEELQPKKQSVAKKPKPKPKPRPRARQDTPLPSPRDPARVRERTPPKKQTKEKRRPHKRTIADSESSEDEDALPILSPERSLRDDTGDLLEGFTQIIGKRDPNAKLCPFCDEPLPPNPSARLIRIIDAFKQSSSAEARPSLLNPREAIALPFHMSSKVCTRHRDEAEVIPFGLEQGWPAEGQINFDLLPRRVRKLSKYLGLIIDGTRPSEFLDAARKEWGEKGHMKMSNLLHQFASFDVEIPGYYGTIGFEVMLDELQQLFAQHPQLAAQRIRPLDTDSYIRRVLLPETAVRLIMEDRDCPEAEAKAHLEDSRAYGVAVHAPLDDLEGIESMH